MAINRIVRLDFARNGVLKYYVQNQVKNNHINLSSPDSSPVEAYETGMIAVFVPKIEITQDLVTVSIDGLDPKKLLKQDGSEFKAGDIQVNHPYMFMYNGDTFVELSDLSTISKINIDLSKLFKQMAVKMNDIESRESFIKGEIDKIKTKVQAITVSVDTIKSTVVSYNAQIESNKQDLVSINNTISTEHLNKITELETFKNTTMPETYETKANLKTNVIDKVTKAETALGSNDTETNGTVVSRLNELEKLNIDTRLSANESKNTQIENNVSAQVEKDNQVKTKLDTLVQTVNSDRTSLDSENVKIRDDIRILAAGKAEKVHKHASSDIKVVKKQPSVDGETEAPECMTTCIQRLESQIATLDTISNVNTIKGELETSINNVDTLTETKVKFNEVVNGLKHSVELINTLLASDDTSLDSLQEIVTYIKANKDKMDKLKVSDITGLTDKISSIDGTIDSLIAIIDSDKAKLTTIESDYLVKADKTEISGKLTTDLLNPAKEYADTEVAKVEPKYKEYYDSKTGALGEGVLTVKDAIDKAKTELLSVHNALEAKVDDSTTKIIEIEKQHLTSKDKADINTKVNESVETSKAYADAEINKVKTTDIKTLTDKDVVCSNKIAEIETNYDTKIKVDEKFAPIEPLITANDTKISDLNSKIGDVTGFETTIIEYIDSIKTDISANVTKMKNDVTGANTDSDTITTLRTSIDADTDKINTNTSGIVTLNNKIDTKENATKVNTISERVDTVDKKCDTLKTTLATNVSIKEESDKVDANKLNIQQLTASKQDKAELEKGYYNNTAFEAKLSEAVTGFINGSSEQLDTIKEIATAIGNDPNYSTTVNNELSKKSTKTELTELTNKIASNENTMEIYEGQKHFIVEQTAHGFDFSLVHFNKEGKWELTDLSQEKVADGIAINVDANHFKVYTDGIINIPESLKDDEGNLISAGKYYFVSQTARGKFSTINPKTGISQSALKTLIIQGEIKGIMMTDTMIFDL